MPNPFLLKLFDTPHSKSISISISLSKPIPLSVNEISTYFCVSFNDIYNFVAPAFMELLEILS